MIENFLIVLQSFAIAFFFPFAIAALRGDPDLNRLWLAETQELLAAYGMINTLAGAGSQLFMVSLVLAFIRVAARKQEGRDIGRAVVLGLSSLSYVVYILAYVGRDGVVYWLMTFALVFAVFRRHLGPKDRLRIVAVGCLLTVPLLSILAVITLARFSGGELPVIPSLFRYFGDQIYNFSDYSSIERPTTLGIVSFPMFVGAGCRLLGVSCGTWTEAREHIIPIYLAQGKAPWLFGTFVSDWVGDFGYVGAFLFTCFFALVCRKVCVGFGPQGALSLARMLLILFLCLVPLWGVFYFRFAIGNGFIVINVLFIGMLAVRQRLVPFYS